MSETAGPEEVRRETPREGESFRPRPPFTPARHLLSDHGRTVRDKNITIAALLLGLIFVFLSIHSASSEQKVMVIDPVGGVTQGPLEPLASSKGYFSLTSINATQAALQRSTVGCDLQEMLPFYFSAKARRTLEEDLGNRINDIRKRRVSTKPLIDSITPPEVAGDTRVVKVGGRLQTTGVVNSRVFYDEPPFELILVYRVNPDLGNKASLPWVVDEIELALNADEIAAHRAKTRGKT
ncbi:MAG TPA: hypothetical protein VFT72_05855 [Opitutaceae bacterium]|nr:hypothetical protein [Opitutaceae bacterium]